MPDATIDPPVPFNPRGEWDRIAIYQRGDLVTWEGSSYVAVTENIGSEPVWYSAVWQLVAEKGEPGLSLRPRGQWNKTTIYEPRDVVSYNGESWIAVRPSIGEVPREGHYWQILARQGAPGMGGPGPRGEPGATGPQGPPGAGGVDVEEANVAVGNATTLDFAHGLDVTLVGAEADIAVDESELDHALLGNVLPNQHHAQAHTDAQHTDGPNVQESEHTKAAHDALALSHDSLSDVSANDHHAQLHAATHAPGQPDSIDGTYATDTALAAHLATENADHGIEHSDLNAIGADDHHAQSHTHASHTGIGADDHHAQSHTQADHDRAEVGDLVDVAATADAGTSTEVPNADHRHAHGSGYLPNAHHNQAHGVADHTTSVTIRDEGVGQGDVTVLDFVGAGVSAAVAGGVATITVTATGGGGDTLVAWVGL